MYMNKNIIKCNFYYLKKTQNNFYFSKTSINNYKLND